MQPAQVMVAIIRYHILGNEGPVYTSLEPTHASQTYFVYSTNDCSFLLLFNNCFNLHYTPISYMHHLFVYHVFPLSVTMKTRRTMR
jgi:hypothetical protein